MTWDVHLLKLPIVRSEESTTSRDRPAIASRTDLTALLASKAPVRMTDGSSLLVLEGLDCAVEVELGGAGEEVSEVTFRVHAGRPPMSLILEIAETTGTVARDLHGMRITSIEEGLQSYASWATRMKRTFGNAV
jgi:hypothetical protein